MKKIAFVLAVFLLIGTIPASNAYADTQSIGTAAKSLLIPGWGQYANGEFDYREGRMKVGAMAVIELTAILATAIIGGTAGAPAVWVGITIFIANHTWSAYDAFLNSDQLPSLNLRTENPIEKVAVR